MKIFNTLVISPLVVCKELARYERFSFKSLRRHLGRINRRTRNQITKTMKLNYILLTIAMQPLFVGALHAELFPLKEESDHVRTEKQKSLINPHFEQATIQYSQAELVKAAAAIRASAAQITRNTASHDAAGKALVSKSVKALNKLAVDVEAGALEEATELDAAFAVISNNMARYQHDVAKKALSRKDNKTAGAAFARTADYIENRARWSINDLDDDDKLTVKSLREMSDSLTHATETAVEGAGAVLEKGFALITDTDRVIKE